MAGDFERVTTLDRVLDVVGALLAIAGVVLAVVAIGGLIGRFTQDEPSYSWGLIIFFGAGGIALFATGLSLLRPTIRRMKAKRSAGPEA
jgi:hypothetical protein